MTMVAVKHLTTPVVYGWVSDYGCHDGPLVVFMICRLLLMFNGKTKDLACSCTCPIQYLMNVMSEVAQKPMHCARLISGRLALSSFRCFQGLIKPMTFIAGHHADNDILYQGPFSCGSGVRVYHRGRKQQSLLD